jgi:hypothetical protein
MMMRLGFERRQHLAPACLPEGAQGERRHADDVDQHEGDGGDARRVDRGDQRHVDQRRAEVGEAAHRAGEESDGGGRPEAGVV